MCLIRGKELLGREYRVALLDRQSSCRESAAKSLIVIELRRYFMPVLFRVSLSVDWTGSYDCGPRTVAGPRNGSLVSRDDHWHKLRIGILAAVVDDGLRRLLSRHRF